ncbi:hypothetical protein TNCT_190051 [Trichonephila clavata]|uniref:Uncharacterized protein n=1 Tax=Trichonephila clavata TaxID=2740835 RepID=A0A8X6HJ35_TRICU|nr:hypothetical protein TNCT_190051 [Trichonephila clavata]
MWSLVEQKSNIVSCQIFTKSSWKSGFCSQTQVRSLFVRKEAEEHVIYRYEKGTQVRGKNSIGQKRVVVSFYWLERIVGGAISLCD